jgi:hypothetical protein
MKEEAMIFQVGYLTPLSVSTLCIVYDRMVDAYRAVGGMTIGKGNRSSLLGKIPSKWLSAQIPHHLTWDRIRAEAMGNR